MNIIQAQNDSYVIIHNNMVMLYKGIPYFSNKHEAEYHAKMYRLGYTGGSRLDSINNWNI